MWKKIQGSVEQKEEQEDEIENGAHNKS